MDADGSLINRDQGARHGGFGKLWCHSKQQVCELVGLNTLDSQPND